MPQEITLQFPERLTTLNAYIDAERANRYKAAEIKRHETGLIAMYAKAERVRAVESYPVDVTIEWHRKSRRTDPDNVAFAVKFILDGLVLAGVLRNDTAKEIKSIRHKFFYDGDYITVRLKGHSK